MPVTVAAIVAAGMPGPKIAPPQKTPPPPRHHHPSTTTHPSLLSHPQAFPLRPNLAASTKPRQSKVPCVSQWSVQTLFELGETPFPPTQACRAPPHRAARLHAPPQPAPPHASTPCPATRLCPAPPAPPAARLPAAPRASTPRPSPPPLPLRPVPPCPLDQRPLPSDQGPPTPAPVALSANAPPPRPLKKTHFVKASRCGTQPHA